MPNIDEGLSLPVIAPFVLIIHHHTLPTHLSDIRREAASAEMELDALQEAHKALIRADALNPEVYGPLAAAMDRLTCWLHNTAEGGALRDKGNGESEVVFAGSKVGHILWNRTLNPEGFYNEASFGIEVQRMIGCAVIMTVLRL